MNFTREIVRHHSTQRVDLIAGQSSRRDHIETGILFRVFENTLLDASTIVKQDD